MYIYANRRDAGKKLAKVLSKYSNNKDVVILALPRGGVPVAYEVADHLKAPMDVFIVRKLGAPHHPELAIGAIASGGITLLNQEIIATSSITKQNLQQIVNKEAEELERRNKLYRKGKSFPNLTDKIVILIDDGVATGYTALAAIEALKHYRPSKIILATPVGPHTVFKEFEQKVDEVICLETPDPFYAVGQAYGDFSQTTDQEVLSLLQKTQVNN